MARRADMRLLLIVICLVLAAPAWSVPVDPDNPDGIAARFVWNGGDIWVLDTVGRAWKLDGQWEWLRQEDYDPPMPLTEIVDWQPCFIISDTGDWWSTHVPWPGDLWAIVPGLPWYPTSVDQDEPPAPFLAKSYPNPFNPQTTIELNLPASQHVRLAVYDVGGEMVTILADVVMQPGPHELTWDGRDNDGREMASGVYFYRLEAGSEMRSGKMVLVR
jgi:hypothetical protein